MRSVSSSLQSSVPLCNVAAEPAATPYCNTSFQPQPLVSAASMPATILSPAPTVLNTSALGAQALYTSSSVISIAPSDPMDTAIALQPPDSITCLAVGTTSATSIHSLPTREASSLKLGLIKNNPSLTAAFKPSPDVSIINLAFSCDAMRSEEHTSELQS